MGANRLCRRAGPIHVGRTLRASARDQRRGRTGVAVLVADLGPGSTACGIYGVSCAEPRLRPVPRFPSERSFR